MQNTFTFTPVILRAIIFTFTQVPKKLLVSTLHTAKDNHYEVYKEALNTATNEVTKSVRKVDQKLAQNIKSDNKSFYAYVRNKQNVRDKIGPLEDNAGNIITQECLMAEELNMHLS